MKRIVVSGRVILGGVLAVSLVVVAVSLALTLVYSSEYHLLYVPFASWYVFGLCGLILTLNGVAFYFWRRSRKTQENLIVASHELDDLKTQPLADEIPVVHGYKNLDRAEFLPIIQILFRRPPDARTVCVTPLPGGYGGSTTVLTELQRKQDGAPLPRSFVVKLGDRREMAGEHDKFQQYVRWHLPRAARFFRHAEWGDFAGIAYEFVGLDPDHEIQSLYQFYTGHAVVEVSELVGDVLSHLDRAWYRNGQSDAADLYQEYGLLKKKQEPIFEQIGEIIGEDDPYRRNFTVVEEKLQPNLKPGFCPKMDIPWHDPVAFLRTWSRRSLSLPIRRSVVHGDLNARNVLIEIGRDGQKHAWFIDFSHTGNGMSRARSDEAVREEAVTGLETGHALRDFCRLEADVKFILTRLQDENDLELAVMFEQQLIAGGLELDDPSVNPSGIEALTDDRFRKAWQVIREIRRRAACHLVHKDDLRPYYLGLLHATLPIVYYHPDQFENRGSELQQKRYALLSAGMVCSQL